MNTCVRSTMPVTMGDEKNFAGRNPFLDSPTKMPFPPISSIFQTNQNLIEISNLSPIEDFGRESLGIYDFGKESLSLLPEDTGRESLGIINLDTLDIGRESLGIVNIRTYDFVLSKGSLPPTFNEDRIEAGVSSVRLIEDFKENSPPLLENGFLKQPLACSCPTNNLCNNCADDAFNDSVFIEGKHVAEKIADGSFMEQDYTLDATQEPEDFANIIDEPVKPDRETVFKTIDKLFMSANSNSESSSKDIAHHKSLNTQRRSSISNSKSKDPLEIISALSDILNDTQDERKKNEGKNLLASLAEVMTEFIPSNIRRRSRSCILIDSGNCSTESVATISDGDEVFEVLDARKSCFSDSGINHIGKAIPSPINTKISCGKTFTSPKILPQKFNITKVTSSGSTSNNAPRNSSDLSRIYKPKKSDGQISGLKRGPMKAVFPINTMANMKSDNVKLTPRNSGHFTSKLEKARTPISKSHFQPIGQSTPDYPRNSFAASPSARPHSSVFSSSKISTLKQNCSGTRVSLNKSGESRPFSPVKRRSPVRGAKTQSSNKIFGRSRSLDGKLKTSTRQSPPRSSFLRPKAESKINAFKRKY